MKNLILTDDEYDELGEILSWFIARYPAPSRRLTYAHVIRHHIETEKNRNENNEKGKKKS